MRTVAGADTHDALALIVDSLFAVILEEIVLIGT